MSPQPAVPAEEPSVAGVRVRPFWSVVLYFLLLTSAALALWAQRAPEAPSAVAQGGPWLFLAFALGFAVYRMALVVARRYSAFKAFFQISISALFFLILQFGGPIGVASPALIAHREARVRAMAAEVVGLRHDEKAAGALVPLLTDSAAEVRAAAHDALVRLNNGTDLGSGGDEASRKAWRERFP